MSAGNDSSAERANIEAIYGLSSLQEGMLFHSLQDSRPGVYFDQYAAMLDGPLDAKRFEQAWAAVAARHAPLRTLFTWEKRDRPLQIVRRRVTLPWQHEDWRGLDAHAQSRRWQALLVADRERGFDLGRAPNARFHLLRIGEQRYRFLWSFHHIILDGWSLRLLLEEAWQHYYAGGQRELPPPPNYRDFIGWLETRDQQTAKHFWQDRLAGFAEPTTPKLAGAVVGDGDSARVSRRLDPALFVQLESAARQARVTLNTMVVGAWGLLLGRYCGRRDVVFGTTVAGRPLDLPGATQMAGLFINTLPLRVRLPGDSSTAEWLGDLQRAQMDGQAFAQTPLVSIQRWSDVAPGTPLFETLVVYENVPAHSDDKEIRGAETVKVSREEYLEFSHFPLALIAMPEDGLELIAIYDPRRFPASGIERMLAHLQNLLTAMATQPEARLDDLPLAPADQVHAQLAQWNATAKDLGPDCCIHQMIEATVRRVPQATALTDADGSLSYEQLNKQANRLARHLRRLGVRPEVPVAVLLERKCAAVVAMLAIQKAGGAYVPLDPAFGEDRLRYVVEDIAASQSGNTAPAVVVVLTQSGFAQALPARVRSSISAMVCLDRDVPQANAEAQGNPDYPVSSDHLAYVIYTSGSTGRPKGVMISHYNLVNSTRARDQVYTAPFNAFLLLSSLATDSSLAGLFWSLCAGANLVLPQTRQEQDPASLGALMAGTGVSHVLTVPSLYALLLENVAPQQLRSLNTVIVAGEACLPEIVARHFEQLPGAGLHNEYGPSETTIWATAAQLSAADAKRGVTIGRPIANTQVYVLDSDGKALPPGLPGELCIGGAGVARGYLGQPERSSEVFVPDPFVQTPDARLYRSGDRAQFLDDGRIDYLGRLDDQIKVRGFRIEPAEIERCLATYPGVADVAVYLSRPRSVDSGNGSDVDMLIQALEHLDSAEAEALLAEVEQLGSDHVRHSLHANRTS